MSEAGSHLGSITDAHTRIDTDRTKCGRMLHTLAMQGTSVTYEDGVAVKEIDGGYLVSNRTDKTEHNSVNKLRIDDNAIIVYGTFLTFDPTTVQIEHDDTRGKIAHLEVDS